MASETGQTYLPAKMTCVVPTSFNSSSKQANNRPLAQNSGRNSLVRRTPDLSVCCLFTLSDVNHHKSTSGLVEAMNEIVKLSPSVLFGMAPQSFREAVFVQKDPDVKLELLGPKMLLNPFCQTCCGVTPASSATSNVGQQEHAPVAVDEADNATVESLDGGH